VPSVETLHKLLKIEVAVAIPLYPTNLKLHFTILCDRQSHAVLVIEKKSRGDIKHNLSDLPVPLYLVLQSLIYGCYMVEALKPGSSRCAFTLVCIQAQFSEQAQRVKRTHRLVQDYVGMDVHT